MWRRSSRDRVGIALLAVATLTVLTLDFRTGLIDGLSGATAQVVGVFQTGVRTAVRPVEGAVSGVQDFARLRDENAQLRRENELFRRQAATYSDLARENARLRQLLDLAGSLELTTVNARVIGASLSGLERTAQIDKGMTSGIGANTAVMAPEGLVGRISRAGPRTSRVLLINDSMSSIGVKIGETGETGIVSGTGRSMLRLELVSRAALDEGSVRRGDVVLTSGQHGGIFPPGIPIGRVEHIELAERGTGYEIAVRPFARLSRLDVVSVVTQSQSTSEPVPMTSPEPSQ